MKWNDTRESLRRMLALSAVLAAAGLTGCQSDVGGQVLPSAWYQLDDVQYFAPGPEFKLSKEAAAMKAYSDEQNIDLAP